jgi:hypothetical protein
MGILANHVPSVEALKAGVVEVIEDAGSQSKKWFSEWISSKVMGLRDLAEGKRYGMSMACVGAGGSRQKTSGVSNAMSLWVNGEVYWESPNRFSEAAGDGSPMLAPKIPSQLPSRDT